MKSSVFSFFTRRPGTRQRVPGLCLFVFCMILLAGCAGKQIDGPYTGPPCLDVLTLPQELTVYARNAERFKPISEAALSVSTTRQRERFFKPWSLTKSTRWVEQSLAKNFNIRPEKAFTDGKQPFPAPVWAELVENSNKKAYGKDSGPAISLRHSNLRAMPTHKHLYYRPDLPGEGYPFDYLQHSSIPPGTPLYVHNRSKDGQWLLAESAVTAGWLPVNDVRYVDREFQDQWTSKPLAAIIKDDTRVNDVSAHIGTLLPMADFQPESVLFPVADGPHGVRSAVMNVLPGSAVAVPMALTPANVALVGNQMMGQSYGWGGLDEKRDCSALTRDLLTPFGIFLPRNSANQAKQGNGVSLKDLSVEPKEAVIIEQAIPFRTLLWMPGHVALYLGQYENTPVMLHNMWGLRIKDDKGGCDGRAVVGKAVVTTLRPGMERPDLCYPESLLGRMQRIATVPEEL